MLTALAVLWACGMAPDPEGAPVAPATPAVSPPAPDPARVQAALERARSWMAAWPDKPAFDAAIGAHETWELAGGDDWKALRDARIGGLTDHDHEHRRFFDPTYRLPASHVHAWVAPPEGTRVNPNRVVTEALFCAEVGWRPETEAYACGRMRDAGGYHTTHAVLALVTAREHGCTEARCLPELVTELGLAQPPALVATRSLDVDLYAERLLMSCMVGCPPASGAWVATLLNAQLPDGSFGVDVPDEPPYHRYHATMMAAWGLAAWSKQRR